MPEFDNNGVKINYIDEGSGEPVVLVHGFASNLQGNWRGPGVVDALVQAGHRVVALDCRGHGRSAKPHDPDAYTGSKMADDVIALMDHLGIASADIAGYSMGGFITASLIVRHPERFRRAILAGVGDGILGGRLPRERSQSIADALEAEDPSSATTETARGFRVFAERTGNDLGALAAMQRSSRGGFDASKLAETRLPVMVLIGEGDDLVGPADKLAATIPNAKFMRISGDHLTAVINPAFKQEIAAFLA